MDEHEEQVKDDHAKLALGFANFGFVARQIEDMLVTFFTPGASIGQRAGVS